jgi:ABC-2 type transport system permease protein
LTRKHLLVEAGSKRLLKIYLAELCCILWQQRRQPLGSLLNLLWPILFYLFFAVVFTDNLLAASVQGVPANVYLLAVCGMFGAVTVAFYSFGLSLTLERAQGWMRLRRASPMPVSTYFASRLTAALLFCLALTVGLLLSGILLTDLAPTPTQVLQLSAALVAGVLPFAALALAIGFVAAPGSASAVIQGVYYALIIPLLLGPNTLAALPFGLQWLVELLPSYHLAQVALGAIGWYQAPLWSSYLSLGVFTVGSLLVALWLYRREEN